MAGIALLPSWLGLLGGWGWILDLLSHFRWQYLFVSLVVMAVAAWRRVRWVVAAAGLTLLLNGVLIGRLAWPQGPHRTSIAPGSALTVASLNVLRINSRKQDVLEYLQALDADVIFLMEVDEQWLAALQPLEARYPHRFARPRPDNFGLALYSRQPLHEPRLLQLGDVAAPTVAAGVSHRSRELLLIGTHPVPPVGRHAARMRDEQLAALAGQVGRIGAPVLLMGDLNATPWSHGMRRLTSANLGFCGATAPWKPTWKAGSLLAVPIDHVLCTPPLTITGHDVGPDVGSDHRPVVARVDWTI